MNTNETNSLPTDHADRMRRAIASFEGLSVGDGFGECFFTTSENIERFLKDRESPPPEWIVTDDTVMALSIVRVLRRFGRINQDALARAFAEEFACNPNRGYGGMAVQILRAIHQGMSWKAVARQAFGGEGSCGNGGAMRAAPIGAYFADDYDRVVLEARQSAEITHAHSDGKTGAAAVALAAAWMVRERQPAEKASHALIQFVLERLPETDTYHGLKRAMDISFEQSPQIAARTLGNGSRVVASDTVPFCLWCAARHADNYVDALWATVSGLGDRDTTCAIVGGIVAAGTEPGAIPAEWLKARELIHI